jgi:hypothetical protein
MGFPGLTGFAVSMKWQDANVGVQETYYSNNALNTLSPIGGSYQASQMYIACLNLYKARSLMMGAGVVPITFRISVLNAFRGYVNAVPTDISGVPVGQLPLNLNLNPAQVAAGVGGVADGSAAQGPDAIICNYIGNTVQVHSRHYLGGVPDVLVRTNPVGPWVIGVPSYAGIFQGYVNVLTGNNGWQIICRVPGASPPPVLALAGCGVDPTTGLFFITTPAAIAGVVAGSTMLQLRGFKMVNRAYQNINGAYQVYSVTTVTGGFQYLLTGTAGFAISQLKSAGTYVVVAYQFSPYTSVTLGREGTHKRGNRTLAGPGRRRTAARVPF